MDIREIRKLAAIRFPFDREHYPDIPHNKVKAELFAQKHLLAHFNKNIGAVAASIEERDHGKKNAQHISVATIRKLIVNAVRLADVSGISAQDISASIENWSKGLEV